MNPSKKPTLRERLEDGARQFSTSGNPVAAELLEEAVAALGDREAAVRQEIHGKILAEMKAALPDGGATWRDGYTEGLEAGWRDAIESMKAMGTIPVDEEDKAAIRRKERERGVRIAEEVLDGVMHSSGVTTYETIKDRLRSRITEEAPDAG